MRIQNAAVFILLVVLGCEREPPARERPTDTPKEPARVAIEATTLYGEFREDRDGFNEKYGHETPVRVTGEVLKLDAATKSVYLDIGESGIGPSGEPEELVCNPFGTINPDGRWAEFRKLEPGDSITINAACCAPGDDTVLMTLCSLVPDG